MADRTIAYVLLPAAGFASLLCAAAFRLVIGPSPLDSLWIVSSGLVVMAGTIPCLYGLYMELKPRSATARRRRFGLYGVLVVLGGGATLRTSASELAGATAAGWAGALLAGTGIGLALVGVAHVAWDLAISRLSESDGSYVT